MPFLTPFKACEVLNLVAAAGPGESEEVSRFEALQGYERLDSEADARFERLVALAADLLDVPLAQISLLDEDRQWCKTRGDFEALAAPRRWTLWDGAIRGAQVMVVEDTARDSRFADNPLVAGAPHVRFYAEVPLFTPQGVRVGALCALDLRPRLISEAQRRTLERLADTVVDLLESYRAARMLERREQMLGLTELSQMGLIRYGRILENSTNEIYLFDARSLRLVAANRGACENLGYSEAEVRALTPFDLMPSVARGRFERLLEPLRSGRRQRVAFERPHRRKDGTSYPAEVTLELDSEGGLPLFVAMVRDLTEKHAYQNDLRRALALTHSILEACQEAILTFHPLRDKNGAIHDFRCLQANAAARRLHGQRPDDLVGRTLLQLWPAWGGSPVPALLNRVVEEGAPASFEQQYADGRRDGWFRISAAATGEGGLTLVIADIGEQKQHERALQRSNEALDQFAAGVAHDLQTPLGQIAGFTTLLERHLGPSIPDKAVTTLGYIGQAADNMSRLVNGLLDYARLGRLTVDPAPVDLQQVVQQCLAEAAGELQGATVTVGALPSVPGNATLLKQVFQNLIGNALKYRSEAPLVLAIHAQPSPVGLRVAVEDNGIGIETRHAERIFEVFRRLHGQNSTYPGLGMGLALTKTIVEAHDGRIWLDTTGRPDGARGSRFVVELPAFPSDPEALHHDAVPAPSGAVVALRDGDGDTAD